VSTLRKKLISNFFIIQMIILCVQGFGETSVNNNLPRGGKYDVLNMSGKDAVKNISQGQLFQNLPLRQSRSFEDASSTLLKVQGNRPRVNSDVDGQYVDKNTSHLTTPLGSVSRGDVKDSDNYSDPGGSAFSSLYV